ncbi:hypothetical protein [Pelagibacterium montanilacus]|uniref:hypothetical protein n=1 Tax=Pelagibacterium montanilacus TaxID=2185280 RepID=UPI000F8EBC4A|nr:hypothetical protein [Pelagibacterium montanilacus]
MPSQFLRLNCYGKRSGARRKPHENIYDIIDEAARAPGAAPHVRKPRPPVHRYGAPLDSLKSQMTEYAKTVRDRRGARMREDATMLYAIVASYPRPWRKLAEGEPLAHYQQWRESVIAWLIVQFGDHLATIVEHLDEGQPHLHGFVIPPVCPRHRIDHRLHPGHAARAAALEEGADRLAGERAYRNGMRAWQHDFHAAVSRPAGHDRIGPRRKRFRRDVALMRQAQDRFLERAETITAQLVARLGANPDLVPATDHADLVALGAMVSNARGRLLAGRNDALDELDADLAALCAPRGHENGSGTPANQPFAEPWAWDGDPRWDDVEDPALEIDDDPDLDAFEREETDGWDVDAEDGYDDVPGVVEDFDFDPPDEH